MRASCGAHGQRREQPRQDASGPTIGPKGATSTGKVRSAPVGCTGSADPGKRSRVAERGTRRALLAAGPGGGKGAERRLLRRREPPAARLQLHEGEGDVRYRLCRPLGSARRRRGGQRRAGRGPASRDPARHRPRPKGLLREPAPGAGPSRAGRAPSGCARWSYASGSPRPSRSGTCWGAPRRTPWQAPRASGRGGSARCAAPGRGSDLSARVSRTMRRWAPMLDEIAACRRPRERRLGQPIASRGGGNPAGPLASTRPGWETSGGRLTLSAGAASRPNPG
jgi:hypothetical protein